MLLVVGPRISAPRAEVTRQAPGGVPCFFLIKQIFMGVFTIRTKTPGAGYKYHSRGKTPMKNIIQVVI